MNYLIQSLGIGSVLEQILNSGIKPEVKDVVNKFVFPLLSAVLLVVLIIQIVRTYRDWKEHGEIRYEVPLIIGVCLAISIAAPAGLIIWILANIHIGDTSILTHIAEFLDPFARLIGLDGYILMAFILGFPANEIVLPILIMAYLQTGYILELDNWQAMRDLFITHGWTWLTAVCMMLFSLMHWPCGTTILTIKKETGSWKWAGLAFLLPTVTGILVCFTVANIVRLLGLI